MNLEKSGFTKPVQNLRDELAIERTVLANERSLLSYFRTTITCIAAGISLFHFFRENFFLQILAILFFGLAITVIIFGVKRYKKVYSIVRKIGSSKK